MYYKDSSRSGNHLEEAHHQDYKNEHLSSDLSATRKLDDQPTAVASHLTKGETVSGIDTITSSNAETSDQPTNQEERDELAAVLATDTFKRSPKLSRLLTYLCDKYFNGEGDGLKEYSIAVEVLGRDSEFDPQLDAVVRVDTHYLRKRLKEYYASEALNHRIQIVIPKGQYIPKFLLRPESGVSPQTPPQDEEDAEEVAHENLVVAGERSREHSTIRMPNWRWLAIGLAAATVGGLLWMTIARPGLRPANAENRVQNGAIGTAASHAADVVRNTAVPPVILDPESGAIRVLAGERKGNYIDKAGRVWLSDRYFTGGATFNRGPREIMRTEDPDIFRTGREGQFVYEIPLSPGTYELRLYFAETEVNGEGLRSVGLSINGLPVSTLDVASDAGEVNTATVKIFKDISPAKDGLLHLAFQGAGPSGFINALEILPGTAGKMLPVRLTMQDSPYRDHLGQTWMPDQYFLSGRKTTGKSPIEGTADPALYRTHRFGNFTYAIPVVEGSQYTITLHFAETWFASPESLGGVGSRVFDVYCNGRTLLKDFDILKETGGVGNRAVVKVFHNIPASAQGKLNLTFAPTKNYALISAIEVTEE